MMVGNYQLSRSWVLREDRLQEAKRFVLFSIESKEKKILNESTYSLVKMFESEALDIGVVERLLRSMLNGGEGALLLEELINQKILVSGGGHGRPACSEYEVMVSKERVGMLGARHSVPLSSTPESVEIHLTGACNLRCAYCAYSAEPKKSKTIGAKEWLSIFDQLEQMKVYEVTLSGGEPFLHPEIEFLLTDLSNRSFAVTIFTNGMLIKEKHIPLLRSKNIKVGLSLDGVDLESHEAYRGKNSLKKVLNTVRLFCDSGVYYYFSTTIHRKNWETIENLVRYAVEVNAKAIEMGRVAKVGRSELQSEMHLSEAEVGRFRSVVCELRDRYPQIGISFPGVDDVLSGEKDNSSGVFCAAGTSRLTIDPVGNVYPCVLCFDDEDFLVHNALAEDIYGNWVDGDWRFVREPIDIEQLGGCRGCDKKQYCKEVNCRLSAYYATKGDLYGKTPFCLYA